MRLVGIHEETRSLKGLAADGILLRIQWIIKKESMKV
jgi:hypothetical protein